MTRLPRGYRRFGHGFEGLAAGDGADDEKGLRPARTASGKGGSGGSRDKSSSQAKKRRNGGAPA